MEIGVGEAVLLVACCSRWPPPFRGSCRARPLSIPVLAVAMPPTLILLAFAARLLFPDLDWAEAFLLTPVLAFGGWLVRWMPDAGSGSASRDCAHWDSRLRRCACGRGAKMLPEFEVLSENVSVLFQILAFGAFGAFLVSTGYAGSVLTLAAFVIFAFLVARPVAVLLAFLRSRIPRPQRLFVAWFGPKGIASILFALLVLSSDAADRATVFGIASFVILASIPAHGLTATPGRNGCSAGCPRLKRVADLMGDPAALAGRCPAVTSSRDPLDCVRCQHAGERPQRASGPRAGRDIGDRR